MVTWVQVWVFTILLTNTTWAIITSTNITKNFTSYEVTENLIDIPDNRTLAPIVPNYQIYTPIYLPNTTNNAGTTNKTEEKVKLKKNSFTILHIKGEFENDNTNNADENQGFGIRKVFGGIKNYVYNLKKGLVDGLHNWFHKDDDFKGRLYDDSEFRNLDDYEYLDDNERYDDY